MLHSSDWYTFQQNIYHTGVNADITITLPLYLNWSTTVSDEVLNQVTVVEDRVFVTNYFPYTHSCQCSFCYCLDANTGSVLWTKYFDKGDLSQVTCDNNIAYLQKARDDTSAYVVAFDIFAGTEIWKEYYPSQGQFLLTTLVYDDRIFFPGGVFGGLYCSDLAFGQMQWFQPFDEYQSLTPTAFDSIVYVSQGDMLTAYSIGSGNKLYTKELTSYSNKKNSSGGFTFSTPVIDSTRQVLYCASSNTLFAYDIVDTTVIWTLPGVFQYQISSCPSCHPYSTSPVIYEDKLFIVNDNHLVAINSLDTSTLWSFSGDSSLTYNPVIGDGVIFVSSDENVFALAINSGDMLWTYNIGGHLSLGNQGLYIASKGTIYYFGDIVTEVPINPVADTFNQINKSFPNPFNPTTTIQFSLPHKSIVSVDIINIRGQIVNSFGDLEFNSGLHEIIWDGKDSFGQDVSSGVYFYRISAGTLTLSNKMILMR